MNTSAWPKSQLTMLTCLDSPHVFYLLITTPLLNTYIMLVSHFSMGQRQHLNSSTSSYRQDASLTRVLGCQLKPVCSGWKSVLLVCLILTTVSSKMFTFIWGKYSLFYFLLLIKKYSVISFIWNTMQGQFRAGCMKVKKKTHKFSRKFSF